VATYNSDYGGVSCDVFDTSRDAFRWYDQQHSSFSKRLYGPGLSVLEENRASVMGGEEWCEVETCAYWAQCLGVPPPVGNFNKVLWFQ
jgi:hypothetical protein